MVGRTISHYKIVERLGAGGMGVVWKAEDTQLRRIVALKFLAPGAVDSEGVKARLVREAQAAAALDHPNICQVYGIHEAEGEMFIAMAYVDGPSLADRIRERPMPLDQALDVAIQIADGLQEAHEKGVVHRDIKPQNVILTAKGQAKITDFGLASLAGRSKITKSGTTLGTPAYMAPEQLEGRDADRRADVWALGCVLYEALTQRTPFQSDYEQAIVYGILNENPEPVTAQRSGLPTDIDSVLSKALAKEPAERYQHADDLRVDLRRLRNRPDSKATAPEGRHRYPAPQKAANTWLPWALFTLTALALVFLWFRMPAREAPREVAVRRSSFQPQPPVRPDFFNPNVTISPDGRYIAYVAGADGQLWVRDLTRDEPLRMGDLKGVSTPFWSPDSAFIVFAVSGELRRIPVQGGPDSQIAEIQPNATFGGTVSPDGRLIVIASGNPPALFQVPFGGGRLTPIFSPERLTELFEEFTNGARTALGTPSFLPSASAEPLLMFGLGFAGTRFQTVMVQNLASGSLTVLRSGGAGDYASSGHLVFEEGSDLWAVSFSVSDLRVDGAPFLVRENAWGPTAAADGSLVYLDRLPRLTQLVRRNRAGQLLAEIGEPQQIVETSDVEISADGRRVAYEVEDQASGDIRVFDLVRGTTTVVASDPSYDYKPRWNLEGKLAFSSNRNGDYDIFLASASMSGEPQALFGRPPREVVADWSFDGKRLLYRVNSTETGHDLHYLEQGTDGQWTSHPFLTTKSYEADGRFSPDGSCVAYRSNESGRMEIWVRKFPGGEQGVQVSTRGGANPHWHPKGGELFYVQDGQLVAVPVVTRPDLSIGRAEILFDLPARREGDPLRLEGQGWGVFPDGQSFLFAEPIGEAPSLAIRVVQNWHKEFQN